MSYHLLSEDRVGKRELKIFDSLTEGEDLRPMLRVLPLCRICTRSPLLAGLFGVAPSSEDDCTEESADVRSCRMGFSIRPGGAVTGVASVSREDVRALADDDLTATVSMRIENWLSLGFCRDFRASRLAEAVSEELRRKVLPYLNESLFGVKYSVRGSVVAVLRGYDSAVAALGEARREISSIWPDPVFRRAWTDGQIPEPEPLRIWRDRKGRRSDAVMIVRNSDLTWLHTVVRLKGLEKLFSEAASVRHRSPDVTVLRWTNVVWDPRSSAHLRLFLETISAERFRFLRIRTGEGDLAESLGTAPGLTVVGTDRRTLCLDRQIFGLH